MSPTSAKAGARRAQQTPAIEFAARAGFALNGLMHAVIGVLAISVAFGSGQSADQNGALEAIASTPGGVFVLWAMTIGLAALGLWLIAGAFLMPSKSDSAKRAAEAAVEVGKGLAYLVVAALALSFAVGQPATGGGGAGILSSPFGVVLLVLIAVGVLVVGGYFVVKGVRQKFKEDLRIPSGTTGRAVVALGVVGYCAKGIALAALGVLFATAAITSDPGNAGGLDAALKSLLELPAGRVVLAAVGVGFIAYGVYSGFRARLARL